MYTSESGVMHHFDNAHGYMILTLGPRKNPRRKVAFLLEKTVTSSIMRVGWCFYKKGQNFSYAKVQKILEGPNGAGGMIHLIAPLGKNTRSRLREDPAKAK